MEYNEFILENIKKAGELVLALRKEKFDVMCKNGDVRDVVSSIDIEVNDFLIQKINESYPDHSIYSEESSDIVGESDYMWAIDPIDGTANFVRGIPHFAICLGLLHNGVPIAGAVYNPVTKELFSFSKGCGAYLNGELLHVSTIDTLSDAYVFFHTGRNVELREWGGESYKKLLGTAKKTLNMASSSLDTCFIAVGRIEVNVYGTLNTLDIASAIGILKEAGGVVVDAKGDLIDYTSKIQKIYMSNNMEINNQVRELLENNN